MALEFVENAQRGRIWLRNFNFGPTGSGKTRGAFELATRLFGGDLSVTFINTELGRGTLYADRYPHGLVDMAPDGDFSPEAYQRALDIAEKRTPGGVIILDSVSHEWMGRNGILQQADKFGDWKQVRPKHNAFVERLLQTEAHLIVNCRAKMKYEVGEETVPGREKPRQVVMPLGVGPIQSDDLQYEFNLVGQFEQQTHECRFSGHVDPLVDGVYDLVAEGDVVAAKLTEWLSIGTPMLIEPEADPSAVKILREILEELGMAPDKIDAGFEGARRLGRGKVRQAWIDEQLAKQGEKLKAKRAAAAPQETPPGASSGPETAADGSGDGTSAPAPAGAGAAS